MPPHWRRTAQAGALAVAALFLPARAMALCTGPLVTATAVSFGSYNASSPTDSTANGSVTAACSLALESLPSLTISLSQGVGGSFSPRALQFAGSHLNYNLYTSAAFTSVWGDGSAGTVTQTYNSGARTVTLSVYGRMTKGQFVTPGAYTDTIVVTVTY